MVSSSPQDEKQKNLKYKLKEPVIRFTYHRKRLVYAYRCHRDVLLVQMCRLERLHCQQSPPFCLLTLIQYGGRRGAAMKGVTFFTTSQCCYIDFILCFLYNRLLDYGIDTDLWKTTVFVQK